jgi:hypothetical protein
VCSVCVCGGGGGTAEIFSNSHMTGNKGVVKEISTNQFRSRGGSASNGRAGGLDAQKRLFIMVNKYITIASAFSTANTADSTSVQCTVRSNMPPLCCTGLVCTVYSTYHVSMVSRRDLILYRRVTVVRAKYSESTQILKSLDQHFFILKEERGIERDRRER